MIAFVIDLTPASRRRRFVVKWASSTSHGRRSSSNRYKSLLFTGVSPCSLYTHQTLRYKSLLFTGVSPCSLYTSNTQIQVATVHWGKSMFYTHQTLRYKSLLFTGVSPCFTHIKHSDTSRYCSLG